MKKIISMMIIGLFILSPILIIISSNCIALQDGDFTYIVEAGESGNGAYITGYTGSGGAVVIPGTLGGNVVYGVKDQGFYGKTSITSISFPTSMGQLNYASFMGCTGLTHVVLSENIWWVREAAFRDCTSLHEFTFGVNITTISYEIFRDSQALLDINFLGLVAPTSVSGSWLSGANANVVGHAYADSDFPTPGNTFNGLLMGDYIQSGPIVEDFGKHTLIEYSPEFASVPMHYIENYQNDNATDGTNFEGVQILTSDYTNQGPNRPYYYLANDNKTKVYTCGYGMYIKFNEFLNGSSNDNLSEALPSGAIIESASISFYVVSNRYGATVSSLVGYGINSSWSDNEITRNNTPSIQYSENVDYSPVNTTNYYYILDNIWWNSDTIPGWNDEGNITPLVKDWFGYGNNSARIFDNNGIYIQMLCDVGELYFGNGTAFTPRLTIHYISFGPGGIFSRISINESIGGLKYLGRGTYLGDYLGDLSQNGGCGSETDDMQNLSYWVQVRNTNISFNDSSMIKWNTSSEYPLEPIPNNASFYWKFDGNMTFVDSGIISEVLNRNVLVPNLQNFSDWIHDIFYNGTSDSIDSVSRNVTWNYSSGGTKSVWHAVWYATYTGFSPDLINNKWYLYVYNIVVLDARFNWSYNTNGKISFNGTPDYWYDIYGNQNPNMIYDYSVNNGTHYSGRNVSISLENGDYWITLRIKNLWDLNKYDEYSMLISVNWTHIQTIVCNINGFRNDVSSMIMLLIVWLLIMFTPSIALNEFIPKIGYVGGLALMSIMLGFTVSGFLFITVITLIGIILIIYKGDD